MLERAGFQVVGIGPEGTITADGTPASLKSKYPDGYYSYPGVTEILACKR